MIISNYRNMMFQQTQSTILALDQLSKTSTLQKKKKSGFRIINSSLAFNKQTVPTK